MRARRRALSPAQRHTAALRFAALASRFRLLKPHARVAFYIPHQGEADPSTLMDRARLLHCEIFLPVIVDYRQSRMRFGLFRARDALVPNRYGSGAGYYDRCLAHLRSARRWRRPKLIGLAYEFQRIDHVAPEPWDVPVDAVLTERTLYESTPNDDLRGKA
jgi:5-formyltetrahydrofolate cyclo-ligase